MIEGLDKLTEGRVKNPNSVKQLKDYFYIHKGIKPYVSRTTGNPTTDEDALKRLLRKGHKEAELLLEIRGLTKLKSTYLDVTLDEDKRLRCAMNPVGTKSGRLSSSKTIFGTGTNMQNQPKEMKKFMLADDGYIMYSCDLSQAENRVVAYIAPERAMIEAFENEIDIHRQTAGLIFQKPISEISDESGSCHIGGGKFSERFWGKKANHGLNYDLGYRTFAYYYEIVEADSKFIVESYHNAYPGVRKYHRWVQEQLKQGRTLTNPFGRNRKFMNRWGHELFKEAYSWIPQSTVADKINRDGILFMYNNQQWFKDVDILNQVHDSIVFQIPINIGIKRHADILHRLKNSLESPIEWRVRSFSIPLDIEMGLNLNDTVSLNLKDIKGVLNIEKTIREPFLRISGEAKT